MFLRLVSRISYSSSAAGSLSDIILFLSLRGSFIYSSSSIFCLMRDWLFSKIIDGTVMAGFFVNLGKRWNSIFFWLTKLTDLYEATMSWSVPWRRDILEPKNRSDALELLPFLSCFRLHYDSSTLLLRFDSEVEEVKAEFIQAEPKLYLFSLVTQTNSRIKLIPSERNFDTILEH